MTRPGSNSRVRGHDIVWEDGAWQVYDADGALRGTFNDKADASLFVMKESTQTRMTTHKERIERSDREARSDGGAFPTAYGTLMLTGRPFIWHFAMIIVVILFVIGVGIPVFSNLFNALFNPAEERQPIQIANMFSSISLLYLSILAIGAAVLALMRRSGSTGAFQGFLASTLFNAGLFGLLLIGIICLIAIGFSIFGLFGFTFARTVGYAAGLIFGIYSLTNYFYREMLS